MSLYAIGDLQGCLRELHALLSRIKYTPGQDRLLFVGDLVNRGPESLETLRFVKGLGDSATCVLGNHDIYLLMVHNNLAEAPGDGSFDDIMVAPDRDDIMDWLRRRPLFFMMPQHRLAMVHAGMLPRWSIAEAAAIATEIHRHMAAPDYRQFLARIYKPVRLSAATDDGHRLNMALNVMTRIRCCTAECDLDFEYTGVPEHHPQGWLPWYEYPNCREPGWRVLIGHWSALGFMRRKDVIALDSGCLWGKQLTAYRLDAGNEKCFSIECDGYRKVNT